MKKSIRLFSLLLASLLVTGCGEQGPQGEKGDKGDQGEPGLVGPAGQNGQNGSDGKDGNDGKDGQNGKDGRGIVSITKASTVGNVDTYVILYSDQTTASFTVTNGLNGSQGIQGEPGQDGKKPVITISEDGYWTVDGVKTSTLAQGPKGNDGVSVVSILKTSSDNLVDTYTITYSNNTTSTFTVTNGAQGEQGIQGEPGENGVTPTISINAQNHWVINGVDSGIAATGAQGSKGEQGDAGKDGSTILSGVVDPESSLGKVGDFYINNNTFDIFEKLETGWSKTGNIKGLKGDTGVSIVSTEINENGDLIVTFSNGDVTNAGHVKDVTKYTVNFYCGVDLVATRNVESNSKVDEPTAEETAGYTIAGWHVEGYDERPWVFEGYYADRVTEDVNLYADFTSNIYEITFVDEEFNHELDPVSVNFNEVYSISALTETGYTFKNWLDENDEVFPLEGVYKFAKDLCLKANWDATSYNVILDCNGGVCDTESVVVTYNDLYELPIPTRTNYVFLGWFDEASGDRYSNNATWKTANDVELKAHWTNTTNTYVFDAGDGACDTQTMVIGWEDPFELPVPTIDKKEIDWEYGFDCWLLEGEPIPMSGDAWIYSNVGKTLTARYKLRDDDEYLETKYDFVSEGGSYNLKKKNETNYNFAYIPSSYNGKPISSIKSGAFLNCESLKSVIVPKNITFIEYDAFKNCPYLTIYCEAAEKPDGWYSTWNNSSYPVAWNCVDFFEKDGINYGVTSDNELVVASTTNSLLTEILIPSKVDDMTVVSIGDNSFYKYTSLASIDIPETLVSIGKEAFYSCSSLKSVKIPLSVAFIASDAFYKCSSLTIYCEIAEKPDGWHSSWNRSSRPVVWNCVDFFEKDGINYAITTNNKLVVASVEKSSLTEVVIPFQIDGREVESIANFAFRDNLSLKAINIPLSITSIGEGAFYKCSSLKSVNIPSSVTSIGELAFFNCSSLTSIFIPKNTTINNEAFSGCSSLTIYCEASAEPDEWNISCCPVAWNCVDFFEKDGINYGVTADNNLVVASMANLSLIEVVIPSIIDGKEVKMIADYAFLGNDLLASVNIPSSVNIIGKEAFESCACLTSVNIPSSVTSIGESAFANCPLLKSVFIPSSVESIGVSAFWQPKISLTIYCEVSSKPSGWDVKWKDLYTPVVWNYKV